MNPERLVAMSSLPMSLLRRLFRRSFLNRSVVILLLLAVPGLSTLARNSWYLSQSNPGHYLIIAAKMKVVPAVVAVERQALPAFPPATPPQTKKRVVFQPEPEIAVPWISLTFSLQRRPPPSSFA